MKKARKRRRKLSPPEVGALQGLRRAGDLTGASLIPWAGVTTRGQMENVTTALQEEGYIEEVKIPDKRRSDHPWTKWRLTEAGQKALDRALNGVETHQDGGAR